MATMQVINHICNILGCTSKILNFCRNSFITSVALGRIKLDFLVLGILIRRTLPKVLLGFVAFILSKA